MHAGIGGPLGITRGPDGALWFTSFDTGAVGRITTAGRIRRFKYPNANVRGPQGSRPGPTARSGS